MNYHWTWTTAIRNRRQHWLHVNESGRKRTAGLVYEVSPEAFSVYGEGYERNAYARTFLGVMPTLEEAKDFLVTITASQNI